MCTDARQRGVTLIELVVFIIIVSVGVVGLVSVTASLTRYSPDPMLRKQMIAIAESLLNEVLQQPFTWCDPDDVLAATATGTAGCTGGAAASQDNNGGALGPMPAGGARAAFNNVADYGGFSQENFNFLNGGANAMTGYTASVAVARVGAAFGIAGDAALKVTVTVTHDGQDPFSLDGYRFRYAPNH